MSLRRAAGQVAFADDVALPGLLHVAVRRSPLARARVVSADATAAATLPGIALVLTPADAPALLREEAPFLGAPLAAAASEDPELARRAADAVAIALEPRPAVLGIEDEDDATVAARVAVTEGDVDAALAAAGVVVEREWRLPFAPLVSLQPPVAVTWLDEDQRLVVRTSTGSPFRVRGLLAERLGLPAARIRVARPHVTGGSGARPDLLVEDLCALVTLRTGRPARLGLSADEALALGTGRPAQRARVRVGVESGRLAAIDVALRVDVGAESEAVAAELLRAAARHALGLYRCPATRVRAAAVRTHRPPCGAGRGADGGIALALECALDEAAVLAGVDAASLRRASLRGPGDPGAEALAGLGEVAGRDDARGLDRLLPSGPPPARARTAGAPRGATGLAAARRTAGAAASSGAAASLRLLEDGSFALATRRGRGRGRRRGAARAAAAAILTVREANVVSTAADTDSAAFDSGDPAPAAFVIRRAVEEAARTALERIREAGARLLGAAVADTRVEAGRVRDAAGRGIGFDEIGRAALRAGEPLAVSAAPGSAAWPPSLAVVEAEVEVDAETGVVRVARLSATVEGGPFADGAGVLAEIEGALAAAVEQALAAGQPDLSAVAGHAPGLARCRTYPMIAPGDVPPWR
ncbi:MAG: molybdopterin cofactor-binding domain-containing protein [Vicinamibacteria bacterium]